MQLIVSSLQWHRGARLNNMTGPVETEVKIRCTMETPQLAALLESHGYSAESQRTLESDQLYDLADNSIRRADKILRLRQESNASGTVWTLTYKGPAERGRYKIREELEVELADGPGLSVILQRLGYLPGFRYEKYRTKFRRTGEPGIVTVDETPAGLFLELEGPKDWIDEAAGRLGFSSADYIILSYAVIWKEYRTGRSNIPEDMIFTRGSTSI
jgi:adenylate cyclase class 2